MKENKLIAEFMELRINSYGDYNIDKEIMGFDMIVCSLTDTKFHTSWDWLMPVVEKCFDRQYVMENENINHAHLFFKLNDSLLTINIDEVYKAVINIIKEIK